MSDLRTESQNTLETLKKGGIIVYPTDTVWGIGCDATRPGAIERIFKLKQRSESKSLVCLVSDLNMLEQFVEKVPKAAYDIMKFSEGPVTIVYDNPIRVAEEVIADDNTLAIRVVEDDFCRFLLRKLKRPIISTSANISGQKTPQNFQEINPDILGGVDYVVNLHRDRKAKKPSTIIKLTQDGKVTVIRE